jgi:predicted metal-dependent hydrolase
MPETIISRSLRKTISMHVLSDGTLEVKAPKLMPMIFINRFIDSHMDWVEKQREKVSARPLAVKRQYIHGEEFLYLGKIYRLDIGMYPEIGIINDTLQFPAGLTFRLQKELTDWYIKKAKEVITDRLEKNAEEMQVNYVDMYVSDTSSKWGSCSHDNRLQFNWRLIMAPMLVLNYVIVHELSHTIHKNHSRSFWNKVRAQNPSYRQQIKWLKENGHTLIV